MHNSIEYPLDKEISYKEFLTQKLNHWRHLLIERTTSYHEAALRYKWNPKEVLQTQSGSEMSIAKIVNVRIPAVVEARANVEILEQLLKEEVEGTLNRRWMPDAVVEAEGIGAVAVDRAALNDEGPVGGVDKA